MNLETNPPILPESPEGYSSAWSNCAAFLDFQPSHTDTSTGSPFCLHPDMGGPAHECILINHDGNPIIGEECTSRVPLGTDEAIEWAANHDVDSFSF